MKTYTVGYSRDPDEYSNLESFLEQKINEEAEFIGNHEIKATCEKDAYEIFINSPTYGDVLPRSIWVGKSKFAREILWRCFTYDIGFSRDVCFANHVDEAKKEFDEKFPKIAPCSDCGKEISRSATACPQCGCVTPAGHEERRLQSEAEEYAAIQANAASQTRGMPFIVEIAALGFILIFVLPVLFKSCAP